MAVLVSTADGALVPCPASSSLREVSKSGAGTFGFQLASLSFSNTVIVHVRPKVVTCPLAWGEGVESASLVGAGARAQGHPRRPPRLATAALRGE